MSTISRENLANLAKLLSSFEIILVNKTKTVRQHEGHFINESDSALVNLIEIGQKAMVELNEFVKNYEAQAFRATQLIGKLMESIELLKALNNGTADKKEIEDFLGTTKSNVVPFALEGQIKPNQG